MVERIEMLFGGLTRVGSSHSVLDGDQDQANPFTFARGDKLLWTLV